MIFILDCEDRATHIQQLIASTWKFPNSRLIGIPGAHIIDTFSHLRRWDWKNIYEILGTGNLPCHPTSKSIWRCAPEFQTSLESRNKVPDGCCPDHTHSRVHLQGSPCQLRTFWHFRWSLSTRLALTPCQAGLVAFLLSCLSLVRMSWLEKRCDW